jgi:cyclophilin family peptidyl-prolyl cis-trans isomerase
MIGAVGVALHRRIEFWCDFGQNPVRLMKFTLLAAVLGTCFGPTLLAAPIIDPIPNASIPAGKSLIVPVTANSPNGRPLSFTAISGTNAIVVEVKTNNPFWKLTVAQVAPANAPGTFQTPFRGGVTTVTNVGDMLFMLFKEVAPRTVDFFSGLTSAGFYNSNTIFHRVVPGFVIQGGDPQTNGSGGPVFRYDDEFNANALFSGHGQLALANSGKDTDGSQFFVTYGPQRFLDFGYTLFGQLLRGFNVLTNVINTPTNGASRPLADVLITRASLVPDIADTVIRLSGTNQVNVSSSIRVIADDGVGGRTTNSFTATTVADTQNEQPILNAVPITNKFCAVGGRLTNFIGAFDMETNALYFGAAYLDAGSQANSTNSTFDPPTGQLVIVPNAGYTGPLNLEIAVAPNSSFLTYDQQYITFAIGDTPITAFATSFVASVSTPFTNQLLATFTNAISTSAATNFTASINWGDNSVTSGVVQTNLIGKKEVRGSHTYINSGNYPVLVTINSYMGAQAVLTTTAVVPAALSLTRSGTNSILKWPAFAFDYQLESGTNIMATNWVAVTNQVSLDGYDNVATNGNASSASFFRLKR